MSRIDPVTSRAWKVLSSLPIEVVAAEADSTWNTNELYVSKKTREGNLVKKAEAVGKTVYTWDHQAWGEDISRATSSWSTTTYYFIESNESDLISRLTDTQVVSEVMST